jgi:hypothetical protein
LLSCPSAYADDPPPLPSDFDLPGSPGEETGLQTFGSYPLLYSSQFQTPWAIYDQNTGAVLGDYVTQSNNSGALFFDNSATQVIDSTGAAPAVGTEWDTSDLGIPVTIGVPGELEPLQNFFESDPSGSTQDLFQINFLSDAVLGNYYSTGPTGTLDELIFFTNDVVPILDIPASASTGAATDAATLWSDLTAMF